MSDEKKCVCVNSCQRCGHDHLDLVFRPLSNPVDRWNWWGICPKTMEPILLMFAEDKKVSDLSGISYHSKTHCKGGW